MPTFDQFKQELHDRANARIDRANERDRAMRDKTEVMLVKNAVALIAKRFQPFLMDTKTLDTVKVQCMNGALARLMGRPSGATLSPTVLFLDAEAFAQVELVGKVAGMGMGDRTASDCVIAGTTKVLNGLTYVYINRSHATPGTIIHELLHFLTHKAFYDTFKGRPDVVEGITEYFTRAVQGKTSLTDIGAFRQFTKELSPRKGRYYSNEFAAINTIDKSKLEAAAKMKFVLEQAYFQGDKDALDALELALANPDMFALVPRSGQAAGPSRS